MIYNSACNAKELAAIGPLIRSALPHYERKVDFMGSWSSNNFANWGIKSLTQVVSSESDFGDSFGLDHERWGIQKKATNPAPTFQNNNFEKRFGLGSVTLDENKNLSFAQKKLLLWHLKSGINVQHIQELMGVSEMEDPNGEITIMYRVIKPKLNGAASCPPPQCESCNLSRAKQRKPKVVKGKAIEDTVGAISQDKYQVGDFVSINQYVVKDPGCLPTGYGRDAEHNMYHSRTILWDAASKYIHTQNQVSLCASETVTAKEYFESWLWEEVRGTVKH